MAQDIIPVELGLPQGDLITLWAPRWRENGEEWEAFLGHEDDIYAFEDASHLAAFVRTARKHDLIDHPAWSLVPKLSVAEFAPDEEHQYDLVAAPELLAERPDTWILAELAGIVAIARSLADVCGLTEVHEILDSSAGFDLLDQGTLPFSGREGIQLWDELADVVAERWDTLLDVIDEVVMIPGIPAKALATAQAESESQSTPKDDDTDPVELVQVEDKPAGFWEQVGIDPIKIILDTTEYYTLRCYLDDDPLFLGSAGKIDVFRSPKALARYLVQTGTEEASNDLSKLSTWEAVMVAATDGGLAIKVETGNTYVFPGVADDIEQGPDSIDPTQLELAVELLTDAADWAGDESVRDALSPLERLGWLVSFVLRPNPTRLEPSPPFNTEKEAWQILVDSFAARLHKRS